MSTLGFFAAAILCALLGWALQGPLARAEDAIEERVLWIFGGGMVALHLGLTLLQIVALRWTPVTLAALALVAAAVGWHQRRPLGWQARRPGWPDLVSLAAVAVFAVAALQLWIVFPDFVFHWGVKGEHYALRGGVDWQFLARPWNWRSHPDYPQLLPELFAVTAILGGWSERAMMAWSVLHFLLVVLAARSALAAGGVGVRTLRIASAALAALVAAYAIANLMAGSADWLIALAMLLALPALLRPPSVADDLRIGLAAALAASAKIEGLALMGLLLLTALGRRLVLERRLELKGWARTASLPILVAGLWWVSCRRHHLFQPFNTGALDPARAGDVGRSLFAALTSPGALGGPLLLLTLPFLATVRGLRSIALVVSGQLAFYVDIYMSAPIDPQFSVQSTFARLAFHLWPAAAVALVIASERLVRRAESCDPSAP